MARRDRQDDRQRSREQRKRAIADRVHETFGTGDEPLAAPDGRGMVLEAVVAFVLGTGFWRLVVSDSWVVSIVFGVLLAALLYAYGAFRERIVARAGNDDERRGGRPRR